MTDKQDSPNSPETANATPTLPPGDPPSGGQAAIDKLKELELSLASELDQPVKFSGAVDSRVDVNPNIEEALLKAQAAKAASATASQGAALQTAAVQASQQASAGAGTTGGGGGVALGMPPATDGQGGAGRKEEDISLAEVDDLLNQLDGTFKASLDEIQSEISKVQVTAPLESAPIGADYLKGETKEDAGDQPSADPLASLEPVREKKNKKSRAATSLGSAAAEFAGALIFLLPRMGVTTVTHVRESKGQTPKEIALGLPSMLIPLVWQVKNTAQTFFKVITGYTFRVYALLGGILILLVALGYISHDIVSNFRSDKEKDPFLRSFNDVAASMQIIPEEDGEDLESPLKHPEYMVLIHRIVANLKAPRPRATPMVAAEFYVEASNQEGAIEIHNRDAEIKDIIERVFEETTLDDLDTNAGKVRLKVRIRAGINRVLNHGSARRVFFKSLNLSE